MRPNQFDGSTVIYGVNVAYVLLNDWKKLAHLQYPGQYGGMNLFKLYIGYNFPHFIKRYLF
jgi:hypothetical protein